VIALRKFEKDHYLMMATRQGLVKRTNVEEYVNVRKTGLAAISLRENDELIEVKYTNNSKDVLLITKKGMSIRFKETDVRSMGRVSMGVRGINLDENDEVVSMQLSSQGDYLLVVSEKGLGKRTPMNDFIIQNRGGKGIKCYRITEKTGNVVGAKAVNSDNDIMLITTEGVIIRISCAEISVLGRITSGVKLMNLAQGVTVASFEKVREKENDSPVMPEDNAENIEYAEDSEETSADITE
jgi:DNA gyrase subunit A